MKKYIYDDKSGLGYRLYGDYYLPDLELMEDEEACYGKLVIKIYKNGDTDTVTDESDEVTAAEQGNVEDGSYTFHICLSQFPRFGVGQVFVSDTCQIHGLFLCIAEFEYVEQFFYFCFHVCEFFQRFLVVVG